MEQQPLDLPNAQLGPLAEYVNAYTTLIQGRGYSVISVRTQVQMIRRFGHWLQRRHSRHTYSTLLRSVGTEFKVMQELLRHSSLRSTLDVYTQAISPAKHEAQAAVLSLIFSADIPGPLGMTTKQESATT
jgi:integrase